MEACGCYLGEKQVGTMHWKRDGQHLYAEVCCPFEDGFIYRVILSTDAGDLSLGVMLPEQGQFCLRKRVTIAAKPIGAHIDRTLPGEEHLPGLPLAWSAFFRGEHEDFSASWMGFEYHLFPIHTGRACFWAHLLCLACSLEHEGQLYGVVCRKDGQYAAVSDSLRNRTMIW